MICYGGIFLAVITMLRTLFSTFILGGVSNGAVAHIENRCVVLYVFDHPN
jgi:hypothetical protein